MLFQRGALMGTKVATDINTFANACGIRTREPECIGNFVLRAES